ncbi:MAG: oxidoreductase [Candidatus Obscuribacterales bacterium]|jgi:aryl-alcohol dehydrogenase-like predicted oxidoreductase
MELGGKYSFPGTGLTVNRMGYGAMQLSGSEIYGPPRDMDEAIAVLREALDSGVNHIDTSDYYGPHITNQVIKNALHPYAKDLVIVSKIGARRGTDKSWIRAMAKDEIISGVQDNLRNLGIEAIDIVNLRMGAFLDPVEESLTEPLSVLVDLKKQGLIKNIGLSTVTAKQIADAQQLTDIVCVQNCYNVAKRDDDALIDDLAKKNIAYVPYFPLGGFAPLQIEALNQIAQEMNATPMQVALAWLLQRSANILLIPGTSSRTHLRENIQAASLKLPADIVIRLNDISPTVIATHT